MASIVKAPLACIHNPAVGREAELGVGTLEPASSPRRVAVVGGGPAGLRAAMVAAQRGHDVTLFERQEQLGGQVRWLAKVGAYREYAGIVDWLEDQVRRAGVDVRLGEMASSHQLTNGAFDAAIVATGSTPLRTGWSALHPHRWGGDTTVPGADQWNVFTVEDVLARNVDIPRSVLVFDDVGGRQAAAVAEFLADHGHPVEVVTRLASVFPDLAASRDVGATHRRLRQLGVVFTRDRDLVAIEEDRVSLRDVHTSDVEVREGVDSVVLVTGSSACDELLTELIGSTLTVIGVGDCIAPRRIFNAVWEGEQAGRKI
ncbi:FAD-dependent oxidoreductase [Actinomycetota bacterium]